MKFQTTDWVTPARVKQISRMIGANYLITGNFDVVGNKLYLVAQMLDVETWRIAPKDFHVCSLLT
jgi:TolB-like protein